jgi:hypothetical protein
MIEPNLKTTIAGAIAGGRVYPLVIPEGIALPAATYQRVSGGSNLDSDGVTDLVESRFQITAIASTYAAAVTDAVAIRTALDGFAGTMGTTQVEGIRKEGHNEDYEDQTGRYTIAQDFIIFYKE